MGCCDPVTFQMISSSCKQSGNSYGMNLTNLVILKNHSTSPDLGDEEKPTSLPALANHQHSLNLWGFD